MFDYKKIAEPIKRFSNIYTKVDVFFKLQKFVK